MTTAEMTTVDQYESYGMTKWEVEETHLLIRKRLEMFGCARSDKVYDKISIYLATEHNYYKNAAACQTRFNNLLKTYRTCVKRLETGGLLSKMRFPYFETFHQYYGSLSTNESETASSKCKSEIFLEDMFNDSSYAEAVDEGEAMMMDATQTEDCEPVTYRTSPPPLHPLQSRFHSVVNPDEEELTSSLAAAAGVNGLEDLKVRLMEQKLLYYTNQNMLLQMKQDHYRQKEQDRARGHLMADEILKVLKGIHSCLKKSTKIKVTKKATEKGPPAEEKKVPILKEVKVHEEQPLEEEEAEEEEEPEAGSLLVPVYVDSDEDEDEEDDEYNMDVQSSSGGSSQEAKKPKPAKGLLKVRKNIFPAWNRIQTVLLIKIHCDLRPKFEGYNLFECVSNKLIELHINRTPRDCRTRWNNLFRSYKDCRQRLKLNKEAPVKFEYFDDIDAYFKDC